MMKKITLIEVNNGYKVDITGSLKKDGERVYENTKEEIMLEMIGEIILGYKVKVTRR